MIKNVPGKLLNGGKHEYARKVFNISSMTQGRHFSFFQGGEF